MPPCPGTGLSCCISHVVVESPYRWTFQLAAVAASPSLLCDTCLYTRTGPGHYTAS